MRTGKKISIGIRLVIMIVCYYLAVHYSADVQDAARIAVVSLAGGGADSGTAESICEKEQGSKSDQTTGQEKEAGPGRAAGQEQENEQDRAADQEQGQGDKLSLCFWREQEDVEFFCKETGAATQATGLLTEGNAELVAREGGILTWLEKGCVMDTVTAQNLFGTRQANGQTVWCDGEAYTVYGTFEGLKRTVVLRADSEKETGYDHLSLRASQGVNVKTSAEQLLMRGGLTGDVADFTFPDMVCGNLLLALPVLLAVGLIKALWDCFRMREKEKEDRALAEKRSGALRKIICAVMLAATAAALFFMLRDHIRIPADMIPTRWSDFSFWQQWWTGQKANLLQILGGAQGEMQLEALWSFGRSVICDVLAIGAGINIFHCITSANKL